MIKSSEFECRSPDLNIYKILMSHNRPRQLLRVLAEYGSFNQNQVSTLPSINGDSCRARLFVLDSSSKLNTAAQALCRSISAEYIYLPSSNFLAKFIFVADLLGDCASDIHSWVDLCSDQDIFIRNVPRIDSFAYTSSPPDVLLGTSLAWGLAEGREAVTLREYTFRYNSEGLGLRELLDNQAPMLCKVPFPDNFWTFSTVKFFKQRIMLTSKLMRLIPNGESKLIEIFYNVLHAFAVYSFYDSNIVFRSSDVKNSLRRTQSDQAYLKKSFYHSYMDIKSNNASIYVEMFAVLEASIKELLFARWGKTVSISSQHLIKLFELNIASYSTLLSYDFMQRLYHLMPTHSDSMLGKVYSMRSLPSDRSVYNYSQPAPLCIHRPLNHHIFSIFDPLSPLASEFICDMINNINPLYWTECA